MAKGKQKTGRCTYCGQNAPITDDHVPPKNIFAKPLPSDLITVPACESCRTGTSLDDEYFRNQLAFRADVDQRKDAEQAFQRALRGLRRPEQERFRKALLSSVRMAHVETPTGIYLGKKAVYPVDLERIEGVVARTVRGLYRHHFDEPIPKGGTVEVWSEDAFRSPDPATLTRLIRILEPLMQNVEHVLGERTFTYRYASVEGEEFASAWLMRFYEDVRFLAITLPHDKTPREKRRMGNQGDGANGG